MKWPLKTRLYAAWSTALAVVGPTALLSCSGITFVDVTEYEQGCASDADCVVVRDGDICCGCPNAAINRSDHERYQGDLGECSAQCDIGCNADLEAFCDDGTCDTRSTALVCVPGSEVFCQCAGGGDGTRTCSDDGLTLGDCTGC